MPIITVRFIKDVVATPEQKREIVTRLTDAFVEIVGEVTRPFVYCLIKETPQMEWAIAGVPMPDLAYLTSDAHAQVIERSNDIMRGAVAQMAAAAASNGHVSADERADNIWRHEADPEPTPSGSGAGDRQSADARADAVWRGDVAAYGNGYVSPETAHAREHRALFERWFEELWNKKNYDVAYELVDPDFIAHGAGGQDIKQGPAGVVEMVKAWHAAMPDGRMTIDDLITEGEYSTIRMTWRATHLGPFGTVPASGNKIEVTSTGIDRVVNGKITEGWGEVNLLGMLQQMGAIPQPDAPEPPPEPPTTSKVERNKEIVHRLYEAGNQKQKQTLYGLLHPRFVSHGGLAGEVTGPEGFVNALEVFFQTFPDFHMSEDITVAEGNTVVTRGTISGTHLGSFMGVPPSGRKITWTGTTIYRLDEDGKIVERWQDLDMLRMVQQMGVSISASRAQYAPSNGQMSQPS